eukprot:1117088-Karenia_brevis.AAC.1
MESFYQMIRHRRLLAQAAHHDFPMPLARLALHLYRGMRHLTLHRAVANPVRPNRGIPPGCTLANTLVKVYYLSSFDNFAVQHPDVDLDVYIDDMQCMATGNENKVLYDLVDAVEELNDVVELEIGSRLVPAKAAVVASSSKLACRIRSAVGKLGGMPVEVTEALGIDFTAGKGRTGKCAKNFKQK